MIPDVLASVVIFTDEWDKTLGLYSWDVEGVLTFNLSGFTVPSKNIFYLADLSGFDLRQCSFCL